MARRKKRFEYGLGNALLNAIALIAVLLPLVSLGFFVSGYASIEPRGVVQLSYIPAAHDPKLFKEPLVTVSFDDGWESVYSNAAVLFERYGIRTTQFIMPGQFESKNYLSIAQAASLKQAGHEIASHTMNHALLPGLDDAELSWQLETSKAELKQHHLVGETVNFAAPESEVDDTSMRYIYDNYGSHRNTFGDIQNGVGDDDVNVAGERFNRFDIIGYSVNENTKLEHIAQALDYAKAHNGWLVLVYHQVDHSETYYSVTPAELKEQLEIVAKSGIKTVTIEGALASYNGEWE